MASALALGRRSGFQGFPIDNINRLFEQSGDIILQAGIIIDRHDDLRVEIDQNVDVAFRILFVAGDGTEQGGMPHAMRPQIGLARLQLLYDLVAFHQTIIVRRG